MDYSHRQFHSPAASIKESLTPQRPSTPVSSPFADPAVSLRAFPSNPFSPNPSRPASSITSSSGVQAGGQRYFHSRKIQKGTATKPWLDKKDPKEKWVSIIPLIGLFAGLCVAGVLIWNGMSSVVKHKYCPVLMEDFSGGKLDSSIWTKEVEVGGYGNGQFEETTATDENAFIKDGQLWIKPTLQDASLIDTDKIKVLNLTKLGTCTSNLLANCVSVTNSTNGTIINPVKSARLNTKKGATIKYGRVEVKAKFPVGDWLWPAIWMLPVKNTYGPWPLSGEIDIAETRGNNYTYPLGGNNILSSSLHWGPDSGNDAFWRTTAGRKALLSTWPADFHVFGVEWSEKYLFTYVDTSLVQVFYTGFSEPLWQRGQFPLSDSNGTRLLDPWSQTGRPSTPFDQEFYLVLDVAVGGTNGWFKDGKAGKPWVDASPSARGDFWNTKSKWLPTWETDGQMIIDSVKMWQQCD